MPGFKEEEAVEKGEERAAERGRKDGLRRKKGDGDYDFYESH